MQAWRNAGAIATDKPRTYFRLEAVFSALQVEPLPPPAEPEPLDPPIAAVQGDSLAWAVAPLEQLADELGYTVVYKPLAEGHGGSCDPTAKVLTINSDQAVNAQVDVAATSSRTYSSARPPRRRTRSSATPKRNSSPSPSRTSRCRSSDWTPARRPCRTWPVGAESAAADTFERIAGLVDRLARRLENTLGAEEARPAGRPRRPRDTELGPAAANGVPGAANGRTERRRGGSGRAPGVMPEDQSQAASTTANPPRQLHRPTADRPRGLELARAFDPRAGCRPTVPVHHPPEAQP